LDAAEDGNGEGEGDKVVGERQGEDSLMDLISGAAGVEQAVKERKKGKEGGVVEGGEGGKKVQKRVDKGWGST